MIVEVFGGSCCGKTTLIGHTSRRLRARDRNIVRHDAEITRSNPASRSDLARGSLNPSFAAWSVLNPRRRRSTQGQQFARALGLVDRLKDETVVHILDEGPLKHLAKLARGSRSPDLLINAISLPAVAVLVTCDFDVRLARMRASGRAHALDQSDATLFAAHQVKEIWNRWIADVGGLRLVEFDTTTDDDWSAELADIIEESLFTS